MEYLYTNRLIQEKSPYLKQHAHDPVDWYPWGEDAFQLAKKLNRPIFLSIGYSTCHWCHVMQKESFHNPDIADLMNQNLVNVKIDREEMPEIDGQYLELTQLILPGGGGWPLNVFLTHELKPFFAATYMPPFPVEDSIGFVDVIHRIIDLWDDEEEHGKMLEQADKIVEIFQSYNVETDQILPTLLHVEEAADLLFQLADPVYGGVKGAPKFPMPTHLEFLLRFGLPTRDARSLFYVELTLQMMSLGGLRDQIGGGFSRYCIDEQWNVPHFEKMVYDNAFLIRVLLETWLVTKKEYYKETAVQTLEYLDREMHSQEGGFYCAQDGDRPGKEGYFYTWTKDEIHSVLSSDEVRVFFDIYDLQFSEQFGGRGALYARQSLEQYCEEKHLSLKEVRSIVTDCCKKLFQRRKQRGRLNLDNKLLTSWNGLVLRALVEAYQMLGQQIYLEKAIQLATFFSDRMWQERILWHRYCQGDVDFEGGLDDYAFFISGLLSLFEATGKIRWLSWALQLVDVLEKEFKMRGGPFYLTRSDYPHLLMRRIDFFDGAEPSGNSVHCENLLRLYQLTKKKPYLRQAEDILRSATDAIEEHSIGCCYLLIALQRYLDPKQPLVVIALNQKEEDRDQISHLLYTRFTPYRMVVWKRASEEMFSQMLPQKD